MRIILGTFAVVTLCAACSAPAPQPVSNAAASDAAAHQAHEAYVTAINSNNLDSLLAMLTDGTRHGDDPAELDALVKRHKLDDALPVKSFAVAAIRRVLPDASELRELWAENAEEYPKWRRNVESLAARLDG